MSIAVVLISSCLTSLNLPYPEGWALLLIGHFSLHRDHLSGIHPEFSFPVIPDMFTYPERCPPALSVYVLTHPDP